jgi:hypothetical protein
MVDEPEETEEVEESEDEAGPNWARMEELIDRTVAKHVGALDIAGQVKGALKGWSPVAKNSKPSPEEKPAETPDPPEPKRSDKTRKKGILSDWF